MFNTSYKKLVIDTSNYTEAMLLINVNLLKSLFRFIRKSLNGNISNKKLNPPTRKYPLAEKIAEIMSKVDNVKEIYNNLENIEKDAVKEITHSDDEVLDLNMFIKKYDIEIMFTDSWRYKTNKYEIHPNLLLFMKTDFGIIKSIRPILKKFVPKPEPANPKYTNNVPKSVTLITNEQAEIKTFETEQSALFDVVTVLRLIDEKKINVSPSTLKLNKNSAKNIKKAMLLDDYYDEEETSTKPDDLKIGNVGIRPFGLVSLVLASKLVMNDNKKLVLTEEGRKALSTKPHKIIKNLWRDWIGNKTYNELNRVEIVKGQKSRHSPLDSPVKIRKIIEKSLSKLKCGRWISVFNFIDFIIMNGDFFDIVKKPEYIKVDTDNYYIHDNDYYEKYWFAVNGRFIMAFLMEYAASIGIVDIKITRPWYSHRKKQHALILYNKYSCLSRYDGLQYFRITPLGEYVLGNKGSYEGIPIKEEDLFNVLPNLDLILSTNNISPTDRNFIDMIAEKTSDRVWKISKDKILGCIENGLDIDSISDFLESKCSNNDNKLPDVVIDFLNNIKSSAGKLIYKGRFIGIRCSDRLTKELIINDNTLKDFCQCFDDNWIMVKEEKESVFRSYIKKMGLVLDLTKINF